MEPLRDSARSRYLDTSLRPPQQPALSRGAEYGDAYIASDKALLQETELDEPYDGRSDHSRGASPDPFDRRADTQENSAEKYPLRRATPPTNNDALPRNTPPRDYTKILAWTRFILVMLALLGSAMVLGANANMLNTYRRNPKAGTMMLTSSGAVMGWWPVWPPELDLKPTWAYIITGSVSTAITLGFALASYTKLFRYLETTLLSSVVAVVCLLLTGGWIAVSVVSYFNRQNVEADLAEWACWHSNDDQFAIPEFSFSVMCVESKISKFGSPALAGVNTLIFATIVAGYFFLRRSGFGVSYKKLTTP